MSEKEALQKWKKELENQNNNYIQQLEDLNNERNELRLKKDILTRVIMKNGRSEVLEEFKVESGYYTIDNDLKKKDEKFFNLEEELRKKIHFNNIIIEDINLNLQ